jgi:toxin FitB
MIVLDTNVVSELMKAAPSETVVSWIVGNSAELVTTAITLAEVRYGIRRLPDGRRRQLLVEAADEVFAAFADQVLPFDAAAATQYANLVDERDRAGSPIAGFDAQIAAICRANSAALATRNVKDFLAVGVDVIDPWQG